MLSRPDVKVLGALKRLQMHPDWDTVIQYLTEERRLLLEATAESSPKVALRRFQGRAMLLKEFLALAEDPDSVLTKLEAPKRLSNTF